MVRWLDKLVHKGKNQKCLVMPVIASKEELVDGEWYEGIMEYSINSKLKWKKIGCKYIKDFEALQSGSKLYKFDDFMCVYNDVYWNEAPQDALFSYNPKKLCALDLKELGRICFLTADDNTQSDDIWESLIEYFEKRGIIFDTKESEE